jgi:two-component system NarL family sensor kinase
MSDAGRRLLAALAPTWELPGDGLRQLLLDHFYRGARIQRALRLVLVAFFVATLVWVPPNDSRVLSWLIVVCYAVWSLAIGVLVGFASARVASYVWLALFVDVVATAALTLVADSSAEVTWTAYVVVNGLFLIPVLAAAQLNASASAFVSAAAVAGYVSSSLATRHANDNEPWSVLVLRTALLAAVGLAAVLLSRLQRRRVVAIGRLAEDRRELVDELVDVEERERRDLADHLHDGALQYVLAARQDLEDVGSDPQAAGRVDHALGEAIQLLRSTLTQLHPAVVHEAGLLPALRDLTVGVSRRARLDVRLRTEGWDDDTRTAADGLLLGTARELVTNVAKHAHATHVEVVLVLENAGAGPDLARLVVTDDGVGLRDTDLAARLREGHLGLASRRIHVEAAGGSLRVEAVEPHGTRVDVRVPVTLPMRP